MGSASYALTPRAKLRLVVLLGLLAPIWWTWIMNQVTYGIYLASGSPSHPTLRLLWTAVFVPSLVLGFAAGFAAAALSRESSMRGWIIFCGSLLVGAAAQSVLTGAELTDCLAPFFGSYSGLLFWVGSLVWPMVAYVRGRAARLI